MLAGIRSHLTYANVTATLALFLAIGGGAYAALDLPRDSVGSSELKRNAVTPKELHPRTERQLRATGDTVHEADQVTVPRCGEATLASLTVRVASPSVIFAYGQSEYQKSGDRPESAALSVRLFRNNGAKVLARTAEMTDGFLAAQTSWYQGLNTGGILLRPRNTGSDGPAYVARPGRYKLRLIGGAFGNCGAIDPTMQDSSLSYLLAGD